MLEYPHFEVFRRNSRRWGRLLSDYTFEQSITGYNVTFNDGRFHCRLTDKGRLTIYALSEWDFGSGGVTVQDLAMIRESLRHDALCTLTDKGVLPWSVRAQADNLFGKGLWKNSAKGPLSALSTVWRWAAVSTYSQTVARWRRKK